MSTGSSIAMLARLGLSLSFVLGLIWCAAWVVRRRNGLSCGGPLGLGTGRATARAHGIEILERRSVGRHGSVAVVRVGERSLLVGITEQQVQLLGELGSDEPDDREDATGTVDLTDAVTPRGPITVRSADRADGLDMVARRIGSHGDAGPRSPRMNLVDALRELTVRRT